MNKFKYEPHNLVSENDVESKILQPLFVEELGYDLNSDLKWKCPVKYNLGRKKYTKECDLIVYKNDKPVIVIEAKNPNESLIDGIMQVDSYSFAVEVRYSLITNGKTLILRKYVDGNKKINIIETTIDKLYKENFESLKNLISKDNVNDVTENVIDKSEILTNEITDYRRFFRSIHNTIRNNEKLDPAACFDEFSKILYLKMGDSSYREDNETIQYFEIDKFKMVPQHKPMDLINEWFKNAMQKYYSDVFEEIPQLNIGIDTLELVLKKLEGFYVKDEKFDVKGRAFEEFLPSQLRGKGLGQFFTPRKIVDFMAEMADISMNDIVVDFACGSGGFLIKAFETMKQQLSTLPNNTFEQIGTTKTRFEEDLKQNQLFGIDAEPRAVRIAKMNMMLWGDGKKIVRGNGLDTVDWRGNEYFIKPYSEKDENSGCTLILANPPFIKEKDSTLLSKYHLSSSNNSVDAQILFLERGINLLRPGGRMLIVLPEGILSNGSDLKTREFIMKNAYIKAIIELPTHTFVQSGVDTINTVVLYIEKYTNELKNDLNEKLTLDIKQNIDILKEELDYSFFIGSVENVGFEPNGRIFVKENEKTDLDYILDEFKEFNSSELGKNLFSETLDSYNSEERKLRGKNNNIDCMRLSIRDINKRLDPSYYLFWKNISDKFDDYISIKDYGLEVYNNRISLDSDDSLDREYEIFSVDKSSDNIIFSNYKTGYDLLAEKQKKKIVNAGSIVYNPYRANIGSIALVPDDADGGLVSGAYINFKVNNFSSELLLKILKMPVYNKYIEILSTGSVRNNFSSEMLEEILLPKLTGEEQEELLAKLSNKSLEVTKSKDEWNTKRKEYMNFLYSELKY